MNLRINEQTLLRDLQILTWKGDERQFPDILNRARKLIAASINKSEPVWLMHLGLLPEVMAGRVDYGMDVLLDLELLKGEYHSVWHAVTEQAFRPFIRRGQPAIADAPYGLYLCAT